MEGAGHHPRRARWRTGAGEDPGVPSWTTARRRWPKALSAALSAGRHDLLALAPCVQSGSFQTVPVPQALAGFVVEAGRAADYDVLLVGSEE